MKRDIYTYDDPIEFLEHKLESLQPPISHRDFATKLGLNSPATLNHILTRYRKITPDLVDPIAEALLLSASEHRFFETLVRFYRCKNPILKAEIYEAMQRMRIRSNCFQQDLIYHSFYGEWYYPILLDSLYFKDCTYPEALRLGRLLKPSISSQDTKRAIDRMIELNILKENEQGFLKRNLEIIPKDGLPISILRALTRSYLEIAKAAEDTIPEENRNISSITIPMNAANWQILNQKINELREFVQTLKPSPTDSDRLIQFSLAAHPITKLQGEVEDED